MGRTLRATHPRLSNCLTREPEGMIKMLHYMHILVVETGSTDLAHEEWIRMNRESAQTVNDRSKAELHQAFMTQHPDARLNNSSRVVANHIIEHWIARTRGRNDPWPPRGQRRYIPFPIATSLADTQEDYELYIDILGRATAMEELSADGERCSMQCNAHLTMKLLCLDEAKLQSLENDIGRQGEEKVIRYAQQVIRARHQVRLSNLPGFDEF